MAYILGDITLPNPKRFRRVFIETSAMNLTALGKSTKKVVNRKERYTLTFQYLTPAQVNSIMSEYELETVRSFQVTETNLTIAATDVLVDVNARDYPPSGTEYREHLTLVLTEVK